MSDFLNVYVLILVLCVPPGIYFYLRRWTNQKYTASRTLPSNWQAHVHSVFAHHVPAVRRALIKSSASPHVYSNTKGSYSLTRKQAEFHQSEPVQDTVNTIYGFFHPNADAGGGGERVLWAAIHQTLRTSPKNVCVVYVGRSHRSVDPAGVIANVERRFGLKVDGTRVVFIYLRRSQMVQASFYPAFTLLGQAIGSMILVNEALNKLMPDVFVDTMGLPFCYPLVAHVARVPIIAYVHYPVISRDMLKPLGFNSPKKLFKQVYWRMFMLWYAVCGSYVTTSAVNSTWTLNHMKQLWHFGGRSRQIHIVYPPCATQDFTSIKDTNRVENSAVYLAQFRPEKRHKLVLNSFAQLPHKEKLWLVGSLRSDDDRRMVAELKQLARDLGLEHVVEFVLDAPWDLVRSILGKAQVGIDAMWNEHFGMVVVEYMAAGLVPVVHDSAGPKLDIVRDGEGLRFVSTCDPDYTQNTDSPSLEQCLQRAFALSPADRAKLVDRARQSAERFSDQVFAHRWHACIQGELPADGRPRD